mmetsp:Transcript_46682/g.101483  ORF Transcript_46682/g.101483 Transcript_46682/m.101483 type:complete len:235 (-) Transcript_46682:567-1271(-)
MSLQAISVTFSWTLLVNVPRMNANSFVFSSSSCFRANSLSLPKIIWSIFAFAVVNSRLARAMCSKFFFILPSLWKFRCSTSFACVQACAFLVCIMVVVNSRTELFSLTVRLRARSLSSSPYSLIIAVASVPGVLLLALRHLGLRNCICFSKARTPLMYDERSSAVFPRGRARWGASSSVSPLLSAPRQAFTDGNEASVGEPCWDAPSRSQTRLSSRGAKLMRTPPRRATPIRGS